MREIRVDPDYVDDPLLLEYLETVWQPLVAALARARQHHRRPRPALRLGAVPGPRPERQRVRAAGRLRRRAPRPDRDHGDARRARLGARARDVARHAAPHRAQHPGDSASARWSAWRRSCSACSRRRAAAAPTPMSAVVAGTPGGAIQGQLNFSRDVEREADRVGFQVMTAAGFAPGGMAAMFEKMRRLVAPQRLRRLSLPAQPPADDRAHRRGARARRHRRRRRRRRACSSTRSPQARARVLMDTRVDALRRWQARDADREGTAADKLRASIRERARLEPAARLGARRRGVRFGAARSLAPARTAARAPSARSC